MRVSYCREGETGFYYAKCNECLLISHRNKDIFLWPICWYQLNFFSPYILLKTCILSFFYYSKIFTFKNYNLGIQKNESVKLTPKGYDLT